MPLTNYSLNHFVAQELADLTAPTAKQLGSEFTDRNGWLSRMVLNSIFIRTMPLGPTRLAFAWVRRAKAAIEAYDQGCEALHRLAGTLRRGHVVIAHYFEALGHFEVAIADLYQAYDIARKSTTGEDLFKPGDGTSLQRLHAIYTAYRHPGADDFADEHIHPVWLRNTGICSLRGELQYAELEGLLRELAEGAKLIVDRELPAA